VITRAVSASTPLGFAVKMSSKHFSTNSNTKKSVPFLLKASFK
jgi:hypothetical protein